MGLAKNAVKLFLVVALFIAIGLNSLLSNKYVSQLEVDDQKVRIHRDQFNIANVHAPSLTSALYAWGYTTAEDRLFQISFRRAIGQGRLSETVGEKGIEVDKMIRELNMYGWAKKTAQKFKKESSQEYNIFMHYIKGINDCVKEKTFLPIEFYLTGLKWEQWTAADAILIFKLLKWSQSQNAIEEYFRSYLLKKMAKEDIDKLLMYEENNWMESFYATRQKIVKDQELTARQRGKPDGLQQPGFTPAQVEQMLKIGLFQYLELDQGLKGSNSWVIGGQHTTSGHPLLCNDPHLDSALPGEWLQTRIRYKTKTGRMINLQIGGMPGFPGFIGKSTYVSASLTTTYSDSQDLYKQKINELNTHYMFDGQWRALKQRQETILVKEGSAINYTVLETHHGPVISRLAYRGSIYQISHENISLSWVGFNDNEHRGFKDYYRMGEINDYTEFKSLMFQISEYAPNMNLIYMTKDDHIGYLSLGAHPKRRHPHMGMYVKDGTDSRNDWIGFISAEQRLFLEDPKRGYIASANNMPASDAYQNGIFGTSILTARADRIEQQIRQQIGEGRKFTKQDMKQLQTDTVDVYCLDVIKDMRENKLKGSNKAEFNEIYRNLHEFDCNFTSDSTLSSLYLAFLNNLYQALFPKGIQKSEINLSVSLSYFQNIYQFLKNASTPQHISILRQAMHQSYQELQTKFSSPNLNHYRYGQFHKDAMVHRPFSLSAALKPIYQQWNEGWGNMNTPNVGVMAGFQNKDYSTGHRANIRLIMSYHQPSEWIVDGGTSESVFSRFYRDQMLYFLTNRYIAMDSTADAHDQLDL